MGGWPRGELSVLLNWLSSSQRPKTENIRLLFKQMMLFWSKKLKYTDGWKLIMHRKKMVKWRCFLHFITLLIHWKLKWTYSFRWIWSLRAQWLIFKPIKCLCGHLEKFCFSLDDADSGWILTSLDFSDLMTYMTVNGSHVSLSVDAFMTEFFFVLIFDSSFNVQRQVIRYYY